MLIQRGAARLPATLARVGGAGRERHFSRAVPALPLLLIVGVGFGITALWVRSIHTFSVMPDELGYVKQSLAIAHTGFLIGPHDFWFASWGQLLPLISAPIFGAMGMVDAFYAAHTLYALLLASTAIPVYLLGRELGFDRLAASLVATLSIAVPWMALAGVVMTEDVAYPAFAWAILMMFRALRTPSDRHDLAAIVAIGVAFFARTQFVVLAPILVAAIAAHDLGFAHARGDPFTGVRLRAGLRRTWTQHRVLWGASALAAIVIAGLAVRGSSSTILGNYVSRGHNALLPSGTLGAGLEQLDGVVIASGIVPFTVTAVWILATAVRSADPNRHAFAVLLLLLILTLVVMLGSFQQNVLDGSTTDRYMFYIVPLLFLGTATWIIDNRGSLLGTVIVGAGVAWLVRTNTLHYSETFSIVNPSFNFDRVLVGAGSHVGEMLGISNLDARTPLAIVASAAVLIALVVRRHLPTRLALIVICVPLLSYGLVNTGYAMTKLADQYASVPANHGQQLGWIDKTVPKDADVGLVLAQSGTLSNSYYVWWQPNFWNKTVQRTFALPGGGDLAQGFASVLGTADDGRLVGLSGADYLVKLNADARFAISAPVVKDQGNELTLYHVTSATRLTYTTVGIDDTETLEQSQHPLIRIFGHGRAATTETVQVTLQVMPPPRNCPCRVSLGVGRGVAVRPPSAVGYRPVHIVRSVSVPGAGRHVDLPFMVRGKDGGSGSLGLQLSSVRVGSR